MGVKYGVCTAHVLLLLIMPAQCLWEFRYYPVVPHSLVHALCLISLASACAETPDANLHRHILDSQSTICLRLVAYTVADSHLASPKCVFRSAGCHTSQQPL